MGVAADVAKSLSGEFPQGSLIELTSVQFGLARPTDSGQQDDDLFDQLCTLVRDAVERQTAARLNDMLWDKITISWNPSEGQFWADASHFIDEELPQYAANKLMNITTPLVDSGILKAITRLALHALVAHIFAPLHVIAKVCDWAGVAHTVIWSGKPPTEAAPAPSLLQPYSERLILKGIQTSFEATADALTEPAPPKGPPPTVPEKSLAEVRVTGSSVTQRYPIDGPDSDNSNSKGASTDDRKRQHDRDQQQGDQTGSLDIGR